MEFPPHTQLKDLEQSLLAVLAVPEKAHEIGSFTACWGISLRKYTTKPPPSNFSDHFQDRQDRYYALLHICLELDKENDGTCGIKNAPSLDNGITNHHLTCQYLNGLFFYILSDDSKGATGEQQGTAMSDYMTESYKGQMTDPPLQVVKIRSSDYQKVELSHSKDHTYDLYTESKGFREPWDVHITKEHLQVFVSNQGGVDLLPYPNPTVFGAAYSGWTRIH